MGSRSAAKCLVHIWFCSFLLWNLTGPTSIYFHITTYYTWNIVPFKWSRKYRNYEINYFSPVSRHAREQRGRTETELEISVLSTCEQFSDLHVCRLAQEPHKCRDPTAVFQGDLVVVVGLAVNQVSECATGTPVHICQTVIQQVHQQLDTTLPPYLIFIRNKLHFKIC